MRLSPPPKKIQNKKKYVHTCRDWLRHGYSCVLSLPLKGWGLVLLIPFISPLSPALLFKALLALESPTPSSERGAQRRLTTLEEFKKRRKSGLGVWSGEERSGWGGAERARVTFISIMPLMNCLNPLSSSVCLDGSTKYTDDQQPTQF